MKRGSKRCVRLKMRLSLIVGFQSRETGFDGQRGTQDMDEGGYVRLIKPILFYWVDDCVERPLSQLPFCG